MKRSRGAVTMILCGLVLFLYTGQAIAQVPLMIYSGDGLTVRVAQWDEESGTIRGEIVRGDQVYPFTGKHREVGEAEVIAGTFKAGDQSFDFTTRQDAQSGEAVIFTTGTKTYRLMPMNPGEANNNPNPPVLNPPVPNPPVNPPGPVAPIPPDRVPANHIPPAPLNPSARPAGQNVPTTLRLKQHAFPDVTMGVPEAYTLLLPADWSAQGEIEWQPVGEVPFPQQKFEITSPQKGRIRYSPQVTLSYSEAPGMGRQGIPPPQNFPQWVVETIAQTNPKVSNIKLVSGRRDEKVEASLVEMDRAIGQRPGGMDRQVYSIVMDYDEDGIRRREEASLTYVKFPPFHGINGFNTQTWSIFNNGSISAPVDQFEAQKQPLLSVAGTIRPTPNWHIHSQGVIAEMSRQRVANSWKVIQERGKQISQISDADYAKYKKDMTGGDEQRTRIKGIYETEDYRDADGKMVNLPMHYHHVFSDGKGNYVLSNNSQDKPGATWNELEPMKK